MPAVQISARAFFLPKARSNDGRDDDVVVMQLTGLHVKHVRLDSQSIWSPISEAVNAGHQGCHVQLSTLCPSHGTQRSCKLHGAFWLSGNATFTCHMLTTCVLCHVMLVAPDLSLVCLSCRDNSILFRGDTKKHQDDQIAAVAIIVALLLTVMMPLQASAGSQIC